MEPQEQHIDWDIATHLERHGSRTSYHDAKLADVRARELRVLRERAQKQDNITRDLVLGWLQLAENYVFSTRYEAFVKNAKRILEGGHKL